jgi:hypothetical protein
VALRFFTPKDIDCTNLEWIYFGYADDTPEMRKRRLRHLNLGGPNRERGHPSNRGVSPRFLVAVAPGDRPMSALLRVARLNAAYAATVSVIGAGRPVGRVPSG